MSDEYEDDDSVTDGETEPTTWVTRAYLESVPVRKCAGERRRAWVSLLYVTTMGFPRNKQEIQAIDDLTRYLEGGFTGPRAE